MQKTLKIAGLHCKNCAALVEENVSDLSYIQNPKVDLAGSTLTFDLASNIEDSQLLSDMNDVLKADNFSVSI